MDQRDNPYVPGAGTPPPELAGRDGLILEAEIALSRVLKGRSQQSLMLTGLRGVGKTVLLNRIRSEAIALGYFVDLIETPENRSIAELVIPSLKRAAQEFSRVAALEQLGSKVLRVLRSFSLTMKIAETDVSLTLDPERGTGDSGDLERDLADVFEEAGNLAKQAGKGICILLDEVQYLNERDYAALIVAAHRIAQRGLPVIFMGAGLPMLPGLAGNAKSYSERLFKFTRIGSLAESDAIKALVEPARVLGVEYDEAAVLQIVRITEGYPYFLQEWGFEIWNTATASPITLADVDDAHPRAVRKLDDSFFRVRLDRVTNAEKRYLRALADFGPGAHETKSIAAKLKKGVEKFGPVRDSLIKKGMIYSPRHGYLEFTVPMFDDFARRAIPETTEASP